MKQCNVEYKQYSITVQQTTPYETNHSLRSRSWFLLFLYMNHPSMTANTMNQMAQLWYSITHDKMEYSDTIMNQIQALNKEFKGMSMSSSK